MELILKGMPKDLSAEELMALHLLSHQRIDLLKTTDDPVYHWDRDLNYLYHQLVNQALVEKGYRGCEDKSLEQAPDPLPVDVSDTDTRDIPSTPEASLS